MEYRYLALSDDNTMKNMTPKIVPIGAASNAMTQYPNAGIRDQGLKRRSPIPVMTTGTPSATNIALQRPMAIRIWRSVSDMGVITSERAMQNPPLARNNPPKITKSNPIALHDRLHRNSSFESTAFAPERYACHKTLNALASTGECYVKSKVDCIAWMTIRH